MELNLLIGEWIKKLRLHITGLGKQKVLLGFTWLQKENPDIDWKQRKIKWQPIEANEDYMRLSVNTPEQGSEEWIESCGNEDEDEWMNSSINPPSDLEDFNEITI